MCKLEVTAPPAGAAHRENNRNEQLFRLFCLPNRGWIFGRLNF